MRTIRWPFVLIMCVYLAAVAVAQRSGGRAPVVSAPAPTRPMAPATPLPRNAQGYSLAASIHEVMEYIVDPAADVLFDSVVVDVSRGGTKETFPRTNEEWANVRSHALILAEAGNLLQMPGRPVYPARPIPGSATETPAPEDLSPAEIQALLARSRPTFNAMAQQLTNAAMIAVRAADARSVDGLWEAGAVLDAACESCHLTYWYPKVKPNLAAPARQGAAPAR